MKPKQLGYNCCIVAALTYTVSTARMKRGTVTNDSVQLRIHDVRYYSN